jgi:hypothetical protein
MKVVINVQHGGYSLSYLAVKRLAELNGKECYAYERDYENKERPYKLIPKVPKDCMWLSYFSTNDEDLVCRISNSDNWHKMTEEEKDAHNKEFDKYDLDTRPEDRTDPKLIQVIEELGKKANGSCAKLKIVEIPDGIEWHIHEYDGYEHVAENHRTWA